MRPENRNQNILGICLGASTVSLVHLSVPPNSQANPFVVKSRLYPHEGNPKATLLKALQNIDPGGFDKIVVTGRKFRHYLNLTSIPESQAVEHAYEFTRPRDVRCPAIVSAGGETFMVYVLNGQGRISNVITGNKCASGTGEFFLQQLRRMNVSLEEAAQFAVEEEPYPVSGRCSVFCKSDCTHATNKGISKSRVTAGLCGMMAGKILELLKNIDQENVMIVGGVVQNRTLVEYLSKEVRGLIIPEPAPYFEALGAALWAVDKETLALHHMDALFKNEHGSFDTLPPISDFTRFVEFKTIEKGTVSPKDQCILGLDVGSTTTKAILLRTRDNAILASVYLRTNGDPVGASRQCYGAILEQIEPLVNPDEIHIIGLGVCGSGRQIAGLHALTDAVINEIIAHAQAAVYFDPHVDTILEIGGQDAKYTYIVNGVPADYAMNEACSAGTGSFLEESARESLGIRMEDIAEIALTAKNPPNFNDQCAAFIASDIKNAIHEGIGHNDIVGGLVYSICMNYANRVKGNRTVGKKIFMQGGVCYNRAIPSAMASLIGKPIVVPPEPGLMGAFGVALEVKKRIELGLIQPKLFDLKTLHNRPVTYGKSFICKGGKEKCDRKCEIAMVAIEDRSYPFGGACNRYYNLRRSISHDVQHLDLVRQRQELVFQKYGGGPVKTIGRPKRIGLSRSFMVNTYFPLYSTFFSELGVQTVLPEGPSQKGIDRRNAAFCYPGELAHGFFHSLLRQEIPLDYIVMPCFKALPTQIKNFSSQVCPFVQGEPFYLQTAFKKEIDELKQKGTRFFWPLLDLVNGDQDAGKPLIGIAREMGFGKKEAAMAFEKALARHRECLAGMKEIGKQALSELEQNPDRFAVVLFGRSYNAFPEEANMGIPHKLASRDVLVIPFDFLIFEGEESKEHMYWGMGQRLMKAARLVERHPQLFGTYITNFSCGPDSFLIGYFRDIMGRKPSLTLELDSHSADAGIETRIEAFIDIISSFRQIRGKVSAPETMAPFAPASFTGNNGILKIRTSSGGVVPINDSRVTILLPSMGKLSTESMAAVFRGAGIRATAHSPSDEAVLKLGRAHTSCKECLPLILTTGTLLDYIHHQRKKDEVVVYFMPTTSGPCRFGQYSVFMKDLIRKMEIPDVVLFSLSSENSYAGLGNGFERNAWIAVVLSDAMEDVRSMLLTAAKDIEKAGSVFDRAWQQLLKSLEKNDFSLLKQQLKTVSREIGEIPLKRPVSEVPVIALIGEIFVRRDDLSRQFITERMARLGFAVRCAPVSEWLYYVDHLAMKGLGEERLTPKDRIGVFIKNRFKIGYETQIRSILAGSGLIHEDPVDISTVIRNGARYISQNLTGEAILTVGSALAEVAEHACGVISIGPFGCMPTRLSEAILNEAMTRDTKILLNPENRRLKTVLAGMEDLPFLCIESDGSPFPQIINAKLETFCLRAERLHDRMLQKPPFGNSKGSP